ncbi:MAG: hypothetical protein LBS60_10755 [Deltaproteobacteria bacterium]|nr:hypothetical protein [Deltaproteobacteria bacterium]
MSKVSRPQKAAKEEGNLSRSTLNFTENQYIIRGLKGKNPLSAPDQDYGQ